MTQANELPQEEKIRLALDALSPYLESHPNAKIDVRPRYDMFIRVRVIDPDFKGVDWVDREPEVWKLLDVLPDDVYTSITMLVLLTPREAKHSGANMEFEDPVHSEF